MMHGFGLFAMILPILVTGAIVYGGVLLFRNYSGHDNRRKLGRSAIEQDDTPNDVRVYRLAASKGGTVTVSDVVVNLGVSPQESERILQSLVDNERVNMEVDDKGQVTYTFPELQGQ